MLYGAFKTEKEAKSFADTLVMGAVIVQYDDFLGMWEVRVFSDFD